MQFLGRLRIAACCNSRPSDHDPPPIAGRGLAAPELLTRDQLVKHAGLITTRPRRARPLRHHNPRTHARAATERQIAATMVLPSIRPSVAIVTYFIACGLGLGVCVNRAIFESMHKQGFHALQGQTSG